MRKTLFLLIFSILILGFPKPAQAANKVAETSAEIQTSQGVTDNRKQVLKAFLNRYNSSLAPYSGKIVELADKYKIPWTWVAAISGVESTFCREIPYNSYNCWGWANGEYSFSSWEDGIEIVTRTLKEFYVDKGADTIVKIAPIYAPPSTTWAGKVLYFINLIEKYNMSAAAALPISI